MSLNNIYRKFPIMLITIPCLYGKVQDTTTTVPPLGTVINSPFEQINETVTDNAAVSYTHLTLPTSDLV